MRTQRSELAYFAGRFALCAAASAALSGCISLNLSSLNPFRHGDDAKVAAATPGSLLGVTSENRLVSFESGSAKISGGVEIKGLGSKEKILGADIRPGGAGAGRLYVLTNAGKLYSVDRATGQATV